MVTKALYEDLEEILELQKLAYQSEAKLVGDFTIPPLTQTLDGIRQDFEDQVILKSEIGGKIVGSVRAFERDGVCYIGRLIVHPEHQNKGIGKELMRSVEETFSECHMFSLFTGAKSEKSLYVYGSIGYRKVREEKVSDKLTLVYLEKRGER
jgi:predicted N-acetyltransferase YhbS